MGYYARYRKKTKADKELEEGCASAIGSLFYLPFLIPIWILRALFGKKNR